MTRSAPAWLWPLSLKERAHLAAILADASRTGLRASDLRVLAACHSGGSLQPRLEGIAAGLESGATLAEAIAAVPGTLDRAGQELLRGVGSGAAPHATLASWSRLLAARASLRSGLARGSLVPALTLAIGVLMGGLLAWKVLPTYLALFASYRQPTPWTARAWLWEVASAGRLGALLTGGVFAAGLVALAFPRLPAGARRALQAAALRAPAIGRARRLEARVILLRLLASSVRAGEGLPGALRRAAAAQRFELLSDELVAAAARAEAGEPLAAAGGRVLDEATAPAVAAALRRVDAADALDRLAARAEREHARRLRRIGALSAGVLTILVGALLATMVIGSLSLHLSLVAAPQ